MSRPHPFTLVFPDAMQSRFAAITDAVGADRSVTAFVLASPAIELLRELRPEEGLGDGADDFVALVHACWRFAIDGQRTIELDAETTRALVAGPVEMAPIGDAGTRYIQIAPRLVWGRLGDESPFEPLDGWFMTHRNDLLDLVACFGVHPERPGVSVVAVTGLRPVAGPRDDGSPPFSPTMTGGDLAGLSAVETTDELLLLGWRAMPPEESR